MLVLITYDVNSNDAAGKKRLRQIAKKCVDYGQRVQNSVFECSLDAGQYGVAVTHILPDGRETGPGPIAWLDLPQDSSLDVQVPAPPAGPA